MTGFECVSNCGGVRTDRIDTQATYASMGDITQVNVQVRPSSGGRDLAAAGASTSTRFRMTLEISTNGSAFDPKTLVVIGREGEIVSESVGDPTTVTVAFSPTAGAVNFGVGAGGPADWPARDVTATTRVEAVAIVNVANVGGSAYDELDGVSISTNAQTFTPPRYDPPTAGTAGRIHLNVAAPHFEPDGQTVNTGHFRAFLPDALLSEWGVSDPSSLTVTGLARGGTVSVSNVRGGIEVSGSGYHYSSGNLTVTTTESTSGSLTADRSAPTTIAPGATATVTTRIEVPTATDRLSIGERFSPAFESASLSEVTVIDGDGSILTRFGANDGVDAALADIPADSRIEVTYEVTADPNAAPGTEYAITGTVTAGDETIAVGNDTVTVATGPSLSNYANRNGVIDTDGLRSAISDWALGEIDTRLLRSTIQAWAVGDSV